MKKRKNGYWKAILIVFIVLVLLANYTPLNLLFRQNYTYRNFDGSFTISEEYGKGFDFDVIKSRYAYFLSNHPDKKATDDKLYRTFSLQPWNFGQWHEMLFHSQRFLLNHKQQL